MAWDGLVQRTGKYRSIRQTKYPKFQTGIFGRMENALSLFVLLFCFSFVTCIIAAKGHVTQSNFSFNLQRNDDEYK